MDPRPAGIPALKPNVAQLSLVEKAHAKQIVFTPSGTVAYEVTGMSDSGKTLHLRRVWDYNVCWVNPEVYPQAFQFTERTLALTGVRMLKE